MSGSTPPKRPLRAERRETAAPKTRTAAQKPAPKRKRSGGDDGTGGGGPTRRSPRKTRASSKAKPRRSLLSRLIRWIVGRIWAVTWRVGAVVGLVLGGWVALTALALPRVEDQLDGRARGSVTIQDHSGEVFAWRGDQFGGGISSDTVSPYLKEAIVATEDKRFYRHFGLDPIGIIGAMRINLSEGRGPLSGHGGSTISQQTAKLLCVGKNFDPADGQTEAQYEAQCRENSLERKAREAIYAMAMEFAYSKDDILTIYMNRAYLGAGTRGFEAASQRYFGKSARDVTASEAAMLAGLLQAPSRYAPTTNLDRSRGRAAVIIGLMENQGYLTAQEAAVARANPATLSEAAASRTGGYFADWVMGELPSPWDSKTTEDVIIDTTLDMRTQLAAEAALAHVFETQVRAGSEAEAAIVVMSPDGAVRAMVGGRQSDVPGGFNRAVQAMRQTGSAFKPFVYATALDLGYKYNDMVNDAPLTINVPGSGPWSPQNYHEGEYLGLVTLTQALAKSLNTPAVRISEAVGRDRVIWVATEFGIDSTLFNGPSLALGVSETSLLELTSAYAGILAGGQKVRPYGLTELTLYGQSRPEMVHKTRKPERVIRTEAAEQLTYMMYQVIQSGTGVRAQLPGRQAAGKSGTTQSARDAWFVGFTADYVVGVWMGYDNNKPLTGVTGGGLPAEIWRETMVRISDGIPASPLPMITPTDSAGRVVGDSGGAGSAGAGADDEAPRRPQAPTPVEDLRSGVERLLEGLFGRR